MHQIDYMVLLVLFLSITGGCRDESPGNCILPQRLKMKPGDIVFRRGSGLTSRIVMLADESGRYSHVGIVVDSADRMMIVHAVPGEPDYEGDPDRVKMETPERFFNAMNATIGCLCRVGDDKVATRAALVAKSVYQTNTMFDHDYDSKDTTKMYCTELVVFAYARAGLQLVADTCGHDINLPGLHTRCLLPSDIYQSAMLKKIKSF